MKPFKEKPIIFPRPRTQILNILHSGYPSLTCNFENFGKLEERKKRNESGIPCRSFKGHGKGNLKVNADKEINSLDQSSFFC